LAEFHNDDDGYSAWVRDNPRGYVLNVKAPTGSGVQAMLHRVGCTHLGPQGGGYQETSTKKVCSEYSSALERWGRENSVRVVDCTTCRPNY
jgi:hypothetical protein